MSGLLCIQTSFNILGMLHTFGLGDLLPNIFFGTFKIVPNLFSSFAPDLFQHNSHFSRECKYPCRVLQVDRMVTVM